MQSFKTSLAVVLTSLACAVSAQTTPPKAPGTPAAPNAADAGNPMTIDESGNRALTNAPPMRKSGNPDHDFVMMMRAHHQQALDMSRDYLRNGKDPELRRMADKIITGQSREIGQFDAWMRRHGDGTPAK